MKKREGESIWGKWRWRHRWHQIPGGRLVSVKKKKKKVSPLSYSSAIKFENMVNLFKQVHLGFWGAIMTMRENEILCLFADRESILFLFYSIPTLITIVSECMESNDYFNGLHAGLRNLPLWIRMVTQGLAFKFFRTGIILYYDFTQHLLQYRYNSVCRLLAITVC